MKLLKNTLVILKFIILFEILYLLLSLIPNIMYGLTSSCCAYEESFWRDIILLISYGLVSLISMKIATKIAQGKNKINNNWFWNINFLWLILKQISSFINHIKSIGIDDYVYKCSTIPLDLPPYKYMGYPNPIEYCYRNTNFLTISLIILLIFIIIDIITLTIINKKIKTSN